MVNEQNSVPYNPLDYLKTPEACASYLEAALDDGDERVLSLALQNVTAALSASLPSEILPLSHQHAETNPLSLGLLLDNLHKLGFELYVRPKQAA
ncbi:MAG: putative addiction module antidote protein [Proteobacteria bacterium]|nr:putative addiction module antidote protein [Pseudomonadota bacterium]